MIRTHIIQNSISYNFFNYYLYLTTNQYKYKNHKLLRFALSFRNETLLIVHFLKYGMHRLEQKLFLYIKTFDKSTDMSRINLIWNGFLNSFFLNLPHLLFLMKCKEMHITNINKVSFNTN